MLTLFVCSITIRVYPVGEATTGIWIATDKMWRHIGNWSTVDVEAKALTNAITPPCDAKTCNGKVNVVSVQ